MISEVTHTWQLRAPRELILPHRRIVSALWEIDDLGANLRFYFDCKNPTTDWPRYFEILEEQGHTALDDRVILRGFAENLVDLREDVMKGDQLFSPVEEDFVMASSGVARRESSMMFPCWHCMILETAIFECAEIIDFIYHGTVSGPDWKVPDDAAYAAAMARLQHDPTSDELLACLEQMDLEKLRSVAECIRDAERAHEPISVPLFQLRLEREVIRAWKYKYPSPHAEFATVTDAEKEELLVDLQRDPAATRRPAFSRDHRWLKWKQEEEKTPAQILDRWNKMTDEERRAVSPKKWQQIVCDGEQPGTRNREAERDRIEKGLRTAKREQALDRVKK